MVQKINQNQKKKKKAEHNFPKSKALQTAAFV